MSELNAALAALQMGIQTEIDGYHFYQEFGQRTSDPKAKEAFERLAQDEMAHLELLRNVKAMLEQSGQWAKHQSLALDSTPGAPIFSRERVEQNVVAYTSDLSALRLAYLIEKDAVDFYQRAAEGTQDPEGQRLFRDLAEMEQGHLRLLEGEYNFLLDQFQMTMGFAPF
ncbi:MAG: ferritin family protein [Anaerolineae bacterium]|jgi:rubrerythrin